jgi:ferredoxin
MDLLESDLRAGGIIKMPVADLTGLWGGSPVRIFGGRCLNVRHQARACRICIDACPVDALSIPLGGVVDADPIALDQESCVRCGLCLHACPTGVFAQANPPESQLAQVVAGSPSHTIELACSLKEPADLSQVPEAGVIQTPRCLAALSVPALLDLAMTGKRLWLNDSICHTCPIGGARQAIQRTIITANRWLQVMGHTPTLRCYLTAAEELADEPVSRPVTLGDRPIMSRRDFFSSLTRLAGQAATNLLAEGDLLSSGEPSSSGGRSAEGGGHRLPHHVPAQRQHLAYALRRLSPDPSALIPTDALPIADVTVTDDCTACGLCAQLCPTEAITFVSDDEYYVLNFSAALCLGNDCNLCDIGCPTNAVLFGQEVTAGELLSTRPRPVNAGRLAPCAQCGAPTAVADEADEAPADEAPLCYVCQAQANRPGLMTANH